MSKRLIRISVPSILDSLPGLMNQELNVVLYNGQTFFGRLVSFSTLGLRLCDLRSHMHEIELTDIEEIILDRSSSLAATLA
jgi:hypothetical protein